MTHYTSLLVGLEKPRSGRIAIGGTALDELDKNALRKAVAIVFQESSLLNASILDNITLEGKALTLGHVVEACSNTAAHEFITKLPYGYDSPVGSSGMSLSSGQQQRIAIARALVRRPRVLILDEATSHLDAETERRILEALVARGRAITTILITHRLTTTRFADRIIVLEDGRIIEDGRHETLLAKQG